MHTCRIMVEVEEGAVEVLIRRSGRRMADRKRSYGSQCVESRASASRPRGRCASCPPCKYSRASNAWRAYPYSSMAADARPQSCTSWRCGTQMFGPGVVGGLSEPIIHSHILLCQLRLGHQAWCCIPNCHQWSPKNSYCTTHTVLTPHPNTDDSKGDRSHPRVLAWIV